MLVIGHQIIGGVPYINGKAATKTNPCPFDIFSDWECPECGARLAKEKLICLNLCSFSAPMMRRFYALMHDAKMEVARMEHIAKHLMEGESHE